MFFACALSLLFLQACTSYVSVTGMYVPAQKRTLVSVDPIARLAFPGNWGIAGTFTNGHHVVLQNDSATVFATVRTESSYKALKHTETDIAFLREYTNRQTKDFKPGANGQTLSVLTDSIDSGFIIFSRKGGDNEDLFLFGAKSGVLYLYQLGFSKLWKPAYAANYIKELFKVNPVDQNPKIMARKPAGKRS